MARVFTCTGSFASTSTIRSFARKVLKNEASLLVRESEVRGANKKGT